MQNPPLFSTGMQRGQFDLRQRAGRLDILLAGWLK